MDRYHIALKKKPSEIAAPPSFDTFGFDGYKELERKEFQKRPFFCPPGIVGRVGIVYTDNSKIFTKRNTHYVQKGPHKGYYILCDNRECCQRGKSVAKYACCLIIYDKTDLSSSKIVPWVFTQKTFDSLREINETHRLDEHDFLLVRSSEQFHPWAVYPLSVNDSYPNTISRGSMWKDPTIEPEILRQAAPVLNNIKDYIGREYSSEDLQGIPNDNPYPRRRRFNDPTTGLQTIGL